MIFFSHLESSQSVNSTRLCGITQQGRGLATIQLLFSNAVLRLLTLNPVTPLKGLTICFFVENARTNKMILQSFQEYLNS